MTIEPSNVRFTIGTKVVGPKQAKPIPQPRLSMAEEAKLINRRARKAWGLYTPEIASVEYNMARHREAEDRKIKLADAILVLMAEHPRHKSDLAKLLKVSDQAIRNAFAVLVADGKVKGWRGAGGLYFWGVANAD